MIVIVEVVCCLVKFKNGFLGNNFKICCGNVCVVKFFVCLVILFLCVCLVLLRLIVDVFKLNIKV